MDWREDYHRKLTTAEGALRVVKSGDRVAVAGSIEQPGALTEALWERQGELRDVKVANFCPMLDYGWMTPEGEGAFETEVLAWVGPIARPRVAEGRVSLIPNGWHLSLRADERAEERKDFDVFLVSVSPPNDRGICSLGSQMWLKKEWAARAKKVIAQADANVPWVYGDSWIPVSDIDVFVESTPPAMGDEELAERVAAIEPEETRHRVHKYCLESLPQARPRLLDLFETMDVNAIDSMAEALGVAVPQGQEGVLEAMAGHVNSLMRDGDCFQIGQGSPSAFLPRFGAFAGKEDLGYHGEMTARGVATMVKDGHITGRHKSIHRGRAVFNSFAGMSPDELAYATENPLFEVYSAAYVTDPRVIATHDNMVSINNGISVDLTGQINSETVYGGMLVNGPGGQPDSQLGALLSKGGRAITVLRSTAVGGAVSAIVPQFESGEVVTVAREYADYIVTEHGVARLMGKNTRERAEELIAVAHPDFRPGLQEEAGRLFWP